MKQLIGIMTLAVSLGLGTGPLAAADLKVAVIDLRKVFSEYSKSKEAEATINERKANFQKELQDMRNDYVKMVDEVSKLNESSKDKTLSEAARTEKQKAVETKVQDVRNMERKIQEFQNMRMRQLEDQQRRMVSSLVEEITKIVDTVGAKEKYNLIFDKSGLTVSGTPTVLYTQDMKDLTDEVIKTLNANAPPAKPTAASGKATTPHSPAPAPAPAPAKK